MAHTCNPSTWKTEALLRRRSVNIFLKDFTLKLQDAIIRIIESDGEHQSVSHKV